MARVRPPAVAGTFYPADAEELRARVRRLLDAAAAEGPPPKAIIAPHAGYEYSGPAAALAYACLAGEPARIERVVLLGPAHRVPVVGLAVPDAARFATPLGDVPVDREAIRGISRLPQVSASDRAHDGEHSLEVHLPFLQVVIGEFRAVPAVVGEASAEEVAEVLESLWGGPETRIVVSSDLSHGHDYDTARALDRATADAIEGLRPEDLRPEGACGFRPVRGLLLAARRRGLAARTLGLENSGDTAGSRYQVVGYGAFAFR